MSATTIADEHPKARTEHVCSDCGRTIQVGETYRRYRGASYDGAFTWRSCAQCEKVSGAVWATEAASWYYDEGIDILEWLTEYSIEPLATQMRNHWRGIDVDAVDVTPIRVSS